MIFVDYVNERMKEGYELSEAIDLATEYCIEQNVLREYLKRHREEMKTMSFLTDFTWEKGMEARRREAYEEGREEGREQGIEQGREQGKEKKEQALLKTAVPKLFEMHCPAEEIAEILGIPLRRVKEAMEGLRS